MSNLRGLIRLYRWRTDEKQRVLAELHNQEDRLRADAARLEDEIKAEQDAARGNFEISFGYANFARAALGRRAQIAQAITQIQSQIATATEALAEAFQEVKRYELAQDERERQDKQKQRHKENEMLDETAAIGFRRRQRDDAENTGG